MKKVIGILISFALFFSTSSITLAKSEKPGFTEALMNIDKLKSYSILQAISAKIEMDNDEGVISCNTRINLNGQIEAGESALKRKGSQKVGVFLNCQYNSENKDELPFEAFYINANGEIMSFGQEEIFARITDMSITAKGVKEKEEYEEMRSEILKAVQTYKNQWIRIGMESELLQEDSLMVTRSDLTEMEKEIEKAIKEKEGGELLKAVFAIGIDEGVREGLIEEADGIKMKKAIDSIASAQIFNTREIVSGKNKGYQFFTLNKNSLVNLIKEVAEMIIEQEVGLEEVMELKKALSGIKLAGMFNIEDEYGILDNLFVRLSVSGNETIAGMDITYRHKIRNINKNNPIKKPKEYVEVEDLIEQLEY